MHCAANDGTLVDYDEGQRDRALAAAGFRLEPLYLTGRPVTERSSSPHNPRQCLSLNDGLQPVLAVHSIRPVVSEAVATRASANPCAQLSVVWMPQSGAEQSCDESYAHSDPALI